MEKINDMSETKRVCVFCNLSVDDVCNLGEFLQTGDVYAHYYCVLLSANIEQDGKDSEGIFGFLERNIHDEVKRGMSRKCYICHKMGATLICATRACRKMFHLPCSVNNDCRIDFSTFKTYCKCHSHFKKNIVKHILSERNEICAICQDDINDHKTALHNSCCGKLLHISCVKNFALNSGYLTKCPTCNTTEKFIKNLAENGVFVPCRDASWELEENAFEELLFVYKRCDANECSCPYGREYDANRWLLLRCKYCGSSAVHRKCGSIKGAYVCSNC